MPSMDMFLNNAELDLADEPHARYSVIWGDDAVPHIRRQVKFSAKRLGSSFDIPLRRQRCLRRRSAKRNKSSDNENVLAKVSWGISESPRLLGLRAGRCFRETNVGSGDQVRYSRRRTPFFEETPERYLRRRTNIVQHYKALSCNSLRRHTLRLTDLDRCFTSVFRGM